MCTDMYVRACSSTCVCVSVCPHACARGGDGARAHGTDRRGHWGAQHPATPPQTLRQPPGPAASCHRMGPACSSSVPCGGAAGVQASWVLGMDTHTPPIGTPGCCPAWAERERGGCQTGLHWFVLGGVTGRLSENWGLADPSFPTQVPGGAMGHPMAPFVLLLLLCPTSPLSPVSPTPPASPCFTVPPDAPLELNLTQTIPHCAKLDWGLFQRQQRLWLDHNGIEALSPSSRVEPGLEELDLSHNALRELPAPFLSGARGLRKLLLRHNRLRDLPDGFFANSTALESLWLDGNPLPAVPRSAFQPRLRFLAVPCRCDVVGTVLDPCACSPAACRCHCLDPQRGRFNVTHFHGSECRGRAVLAAGAAAAAAVVALALAVAAVVWHRRRAAAAGVGGAKWDAVAAHGQPRYVSRADGIDGTDGSAPDYENVLVSPRRATATAQGWTPGWQRHSPQVPVGDECSPRSEDVWDQPVYVNALSLCQDSIYITPDQ
ncbi:uncharacterized protein LOC130601726 [Pezoporus wallicus]|uniref:uncharacterized protein LOC130601726 n=1 Tax=Pezoporus wallicus TaxID=35540 RepID=UPI00255131CC|nr:uncharacterized protein LOC130601726 [Pezoporus wallicus]